MRRFFPGLVASLALSAVAAQAGALSVQMDQARLVTFSRPVATVDVGNPSIADVQVVDARHVLVLGKVFGVTNLIGLDGHGHQLVNDVVTVVARAADEVTLDRGTREMTYACADHRCEPGALPTDSAKYFNTANAQAQSYEARGTAAAGRR
jgi:hypothetical protein